MSILRLRQRHTGKGGGGVGPVICCNYELQTVKLSKKRKLL